MSNSKLAVIATNLETQAGASTVTSRGLPGYWKRIAAAAEAIAGSSSSANSQPSGYQRRTAVAFEALAGTSPAGSNPTSAGYERRIALAMEALTGQSGTGTWLNRIFQLSDDDLTPASAPPADWRMPASAATLDGVSNASLLSAQATAGAKSRPGVALTATASTIIIYQVAAHTEPLILSWVSSLASGQTFTVETAPDGVTWTNLSYVKPVPTGFTANNRRLADLIPAGGAKHIRLTIANSGAADTIYPLLHKLPATGPWDAHLLVGASREEELMGTTMTSGFFPWETAVVSAYSTRDPLIFSWAMFGATGGEITSSATVTGIPAYAGICYYGYVGSFIGNNITADRPFDESERAALEGYYNSLGAAFTSAGISPCFANISYRNYSTGTPTPPTSQAGGSLEYNLELVHARIAALSPSWYDSSIGRPRIDEYLAVLFDRGNLEDAQHGSPTGDANMRVHKVQNYFRKIYDGTFPASQIEQRVATYELTPTVANQNEANYANAGLAVGAVRSAFQARINAVVIPPSAYIQRTIDFIARWSVPPDTTQADKIDVLMRVLDALPTRRFVMYDAPASQSALLDWYDDANNQSVGAGMTFVANSHYTGTASGYIFFGDVPADIWLGGKDNMTLALGVKTINSTGPFLGTSAAGAYIYMSPTNTRFGHSTAGTAMSNPAGNYILSRQAATEYTLKRDTVARVTYTQANEALPAVGQPRLNNSVATYGLHSYTHAGCFDYLTEAQENTLNTAIATYLL